MSDTPNKAQAYLLLGIACVPLLFYPFLVIANLMSLAAGNAGVGALAFVVSQAFLWTTTLYPVVLVACFVVFRLRKRMVWAAMPLYYLAGCTALFVWWARF